MLRDVDGACRLWDEISLARRYEKAVAREDFQVCTLAVDFDRHAATLACDDGYIDFAKAIDCTDFPITEAKLDFANNTILLPSEY